MGHHAKKESETLRPYILTLSQLYVNLSLCSQCKLPGVTQTEMKGKYTSFK